MTLFIRIPQAGDNLPALRIHATLQLLRHRLPLAGSRIKPDIGNPFPMHQQSHTSLMTFRIDILESHYVDSPVYEVTDFLFQAESGRIHVFVHEGSFFHSIADSGSDQRRSFR